jgi:hypothetical protein
MDYDDLDALEICWECLGYGVCICDEEVECTG